MAGNTKPPPAATTEPFAVQKKGCDQLIALQARAPSLGLPKPQLDDINSTLGSYYATAGCGSIM